MNLIFRSFSFLVLFLVVFDSHGQIKADFGNDQQFLYDTTSGSFSLQKSGNFYLKDAVSTIALKGGNPVSINNTTTKIQKNTFKDDAGKGTLYTVSRKANNNLEVKQHFYLYDDQPFIVIQVELVGKNLSSNQIIPVFMENQSLKLGNDLRSVFVPFDNDTFISYESYPLGNQQQPTSSEASAIYDGETNNGLILASLDQANWKTGITSKGSPNALTDLSIANGFTDVSVTRDAMEHGFLKGDTILSSKILLGYSTDWREGMEQYAHFQRKLHPPYIQEWKEGTPVGWNSWGVIQDKLTYKQAVATADYFDQRIPSFRNENGQAFIDLDSFWDNLIAGGMSGDYSKLKDFVAHCKSLNLEPGVYWAPFTDWGHSSGPDRKAEGSNHTFGEMWTKTANGYHDLDGGRALDPTHPGTRARMKYILDKLVDCGFKMIKIDFLAHGAIESISFHNPAVHTGMQAYAKGMEYLNDLLQDKMIIYAAISPSLATYKHAHMRRIACDAWNTMQQTEYTLNSLTYGWWQTHLYDFIDADHLVFRGSSHEVNKARLTSGIVAGTIILGDDFSKKEEWDITVNAYLQDPEILAIIKDGKSFRPLSLANGKEASDAFYKRHGEDTYLAIFNYDDKVKAYTVDLASLGLTHETYSAVELFTKNTNTLKDQTVLSLQNESVVLLKIKKNQ